MDVDEDKDWRGSDKKHLKVKWQAIDEYDVLRAGAGGFWVRMGSREVRPSPPRALGPEASAEYSDSNIQALRAFLLGSGACVGC